MIQFGDVAGIIYFLLVPKFYYEFRLVNYVGPKDGATKAWFSQINMYFF